MSANNWVICPRCKITRAEQVSKRLKEMQEQYGKIEQEEFIKLRQEVIDFAGEPIENKLREDWYIGTDSDGEFSVDYYCSCQTCGFNHTFKHTEQLKT